MNIRNVKHPQKKKRIRILSPNLPESVNAQCYWAQANSFAYAAEQLLTNQSGKILVPALYLLGHSFELHLKAFLIQQGVPEKKLRLEFGHDLVASLRKCKELGLCQHLLLSYRQIRQIVRVNHYYEGKQLEYFYATQKLFGSIESFRNIVNQTSRTVFTPIAANDFRTLSENTT